VIIQDTSYKNYLDPAVVSKLNTIELKAKMVVEGFMVGMHKSPYHGFSVEFSEHRPYMQGDPIKNIDWKVYGKSERFYVKQYEEETNLISHVLLDTSRSMAFKHSGVVSKLEYGGILAASLMYLMLKQQDAAGIVLYSDEIETYMPPKSQRTYLSPLLRAIAAVEPTNKTNTALCLNKISEKIKRRGLVVVISDFFDDPETVIAALKRFHFKKNEIIVFQLLDPIEKSFAFGKDSIFIDMETREELTTQPGQIQKAYQETMGEFLNKIKTECRNSGIEYNLITTDTPFDKALLNYFKKRAKLV